MPGQPAVPAFQHPVPEGAAATTTGTLAAGVMTVDGTPTNFNTPDPEPGPWGCNAADACANLAVLQWAYPSPTGDDPTRTVAVFACPDHEGLA